ncbi:hypothetical protein EI94DRAFT_1705678 [Lactarius quietus]|nr:hypothetical protein EI94DRAFT_1705678 [Lactarius quietus]
MNRNARLAASHAALPSLLLLLHIWGLILKGRRVDRNSLSCQGFHTFYVIDCDKCMTTSARVIFRLHSPAVPPLARSTSQAGTGTADTQDHGPGDRDYKDSGSGIGFWHASGLRRGAFGGLTTHERTRKPYRSHGASMKSPPATIACENNAEGLDGLLRTHEYVRTTDGVWTGSCVSQLREARTASPAQKVQPTNLTGTEETTETCRAECNIVIINITGTKVLTSNGRYGVLEHGGRSGVLAFGHPGADGMGLFVGVKT